MLDDNQENFAIWLSQVANGYGDKEGDPAKAIDLLVKLAEYGAPKLARTEHIGENGSAIKFEVTMPWLQQQVQSRNQ